MTPNRTLTIRSVRLALREGDVITMSGRPLRGWRRLIAWLFGWPLTEMERLVVRGLTSDLVSEVSEQEDG